MCSLFLYAADSLAGKLHVLERHSGEATGTVDHSKAENAERERERDREQETETETGDRNTGAVGKHQARRALQTTLEMLDLLLRALGSH